MAVRCEQSQRTLQQLMRLWRARSWQEPIGGLGDALSASARWRAAAAPATPAHRVQLLKTASAAFAQPSTAHIGLVAAAATSTAGARTAGPPCVRRQLRGLLHSYRQLSKAKLSALVALTASAGFAAGSGGVIDWYGLAWTSLGTFSAAACANSLNQLYEVANDARMTRTCNRPLPTGRLSRAHAVAFAAVTGAAGLWMLADKANLLTAGLGAANILLYAGLYTPLKQVSPVNTWVGAVVGAIPPLMGWTAAAGALEPGAWLLAAGLFSWQMPHFMALAWLCKDDYARGGFRMLSAADPSGRRTAAVAARHCAYLLPLGAAAVVLQVAGPWFAAEAVLLAAGMGVGAAGFVAAPSQASARRLFRYSLLYLPLLLLGLVAHRQPNTHANWDQLRARARDEWGVALPRLALPRLALPELRLPELPELRLRPVEERLVYVLELQRSMQQHMIKCPSRVYAESGGAAATPEGGEERQQLGEGGDRSEHVAASAAPQSQQRQQQQQQQQQQPGPPWSAGG